jgi:hypothetical protein
MAGKRKWRTSAGAHDFGYQAFGLDDGLSRQPLHSAPFDLR